MVYCTYCGQSFTRDEHLERHILTHTNIKPFKCFTCHMSFARRDLLQRHYLVHGKDQDKAAIPAANGMIPKSAGRTPIACSNCAKTKTKCDKKFPCSRCSARNLTCTVRPVRRATKGGQRLGDSGDISIAPGMSLETGAQSQPQDITPAPSRPPLKPASPKNVQPAPDVRPAVQFGDSPPMPMPGTLTSTPVSGATSNFMLETPLSYDDFTRPNTGSSETLSSPNFMLDWSALQVPLGLGYEAMVQPHMLLQPSPDSLHFDPQQLLPLAPPPSANGMLTIIPDLPNGVLTPDVTPKHERTLEDVNANTANGVHVARHSVDSNGELVGEMPAIIQARDAWSTFRCTPTISSSACPKTARLHLERLEQTLKDHEGWSTWTPTFDEAEGAGGDYMTVMQLHESTRDKLLAIMQSFLHKALEIHREGTNHQFSATGLPTPNGASNFVLLPPGRVLEYFLRSYANRFERYYPLTSRGTLDANELMHCYNDRAASLLVLMMIAQGAMVEARMLTGGLTEAARISLFDLIEKNIIMASDPIVLHAALLFTVQAAWSGDKWQMDIAKGQRNMYFSMLRHSGALESRPPPPVPRENVNTDQLWVEWIQAESRSRLVYSSVMIDQELALFNDMAPLISVTECVTPMPDADRLWQTKTAAQWSQMFEQVHEFSSGFSSVGSGARPPSLRDVFRSFLDGELEGLGDQLTPLQLRLLLSPLQSQVVQLSQLLTCFSDSTAHRPSSSSSSNGSSRGPTKDTIRSRLSEIQALLSGWFALTERYLKYHPMCAMMQINVIIFHLISLNAVTDFPEIERLARGENHDASFLRQRCIVDTEEAVFHCGQVLRMVRMMPRGIRPPWWTAAVYRAALILWTNALTQASTSSPLQAHFPVATGPSFAIDDLGPDHPLVIKYLTKREGVPCVTKHDGGLMGIDQPFAVLQHCVEVIDEGAATRFADGIRAKLEQLAQC